MKFLKPDLHISWLSEIDIAYWYEKGIRCILIDLDNTISPWRKTGITEDALDLIDRARKAGVTVVLFTNAKEERAREAAWNAGISYYSSARKPFPYRYKKAIAELSLTKAKVMAVGDQVFTDVLGGNVAGCTTVLTSPLSPVEFIGTRVMRFFEKHIAGRKITYREDAKPASPSGS